MARLYPEYRGEVQKKIIAAAHDIFHEKGYTNTKMSDIADVLGVTKPTIYNYFDTKENLFVAVADYERKKLEELILESFEGRDFASGAAVFFDTVMEGYLGNVGPESVALITRDEKLRAIILQDREEFLAVITRFLAGRQARGEIREDADTGILACTFNALFQGLLIYAMQGMDIDELRSVWNSTVRVLTEKE
ncbi:MAG: TetR/AcrR family transcriptional regulator [Methanoregulaceae archaeon]|nr:TetR/AcrR family transcriptional regulator [Methanoregulaceae archaeon]